MTDPIERLLEVEQQAQQIIAQAREEAAATMERARTEAQRIGAEARQRARAEAGEAVSRRHAEAEREREAALRSAAEEAPDVGLLDEQKLRRAVERIVEAVAPAE